MNVNVLADHMSMFMLLNFFVSCNESSVDD